MEQERKSPIGLLIFICLALSVYAIYQNVTMKTEINELKEIIHGSDESASETETAAEVKAEPEEPKAVVEKPAAKPAAKETSAPKAAKVKKIVPSAKARVENRYVEGEVVLPEGKFLEEGTVTVNVYVDFMGTVTKTEIASSTINDEEVKYACREAALKTDFSLDVHAGADSRLKGTIVYTFSAR